MSKVNELIQQYTSDAIEIRRHIHRHPELSMEEKNTTEFISQQLLKYGIEISDIPFKSGVLGILKGGEDGHTILLRADIDALPMVEKSGLPFASENTGVCHSCGHDIHTTALLLAARVLSSLRDELKGTVLFLFQPAEERLSGSQMVIDSGVFEKYHPDFAVGLHCWPDIPAGTIGIRRGSFMASSDTVKLTIRGKGGHGAHPHKSIDPVMTSAYILTELQTIISRTIAPLDSAVLTIGKITGGTAANIIPDEVVMEGTVRTVSKETRALMEETLELYDQEWRGIGAIPKSGLRLKEIFARQDASYLLLAPDTEAYKKCLDDPASSVEKRQCIAGDIMRGTKQTKDCPFFGTLCTPEHPIGAPMVSSEGVCAAYYRYK